MKNKKSTDQNLWKSSHCPKTSITAYIYDIYTYSRHRQQEQLNDCSCPVADAEGHVPFGFNPSDSPFPDGMAVVTIFARKTTENPQKAYSV